MKYLPSPARSAAMLISFMVILGALIPAQSRASTFGDFVASIFGVTGTQVNVISGASNLQTMSLPKPAMNANPMAGKGGGEIKIVDGTAVSADEGPSGTPVEYQRVNDATISIHTVREGETLSGIAKLYKVTTDTILWANDLSRSSKLQIGQVLTILPVPGVKYTVKKGDTLASVAKRFGGDVVEVASYNGIEDGTLVVGEEIIIPDGEIVPASTPKGGGVTVGPAKGTPTQIGYYLRPIVGGVRTQGIHGYNGIDLAAPVGTPLLASAEGDVIIAKQTGWNGGYGAYIVIQHQNGTQTLYSHASKVTVSVGEHVTRGEVIGAVGATGKATGPHVHFEIRNGIRNPF